MRHRQNMGTCIGCCFVGSIVSVGLSGHLYPINRTRFCFFRLVPASNAVRKRVQKKKKREKRTMRRTRLRTHKRRTRGRVWGEEG